MPTMSFSTPILTYHSQNVRGSSPADNDHVALRLDLEAMHGAGWQIIPLTLLLDGIEGRLKDADLDRTVCLTFDDGCDFDVHDLDYPGFGRQRSFLGILQDFADAHGDKAQPKLHASTFVIASDQARQIIDSRSLFGHGWISDDWWAAAESHPLMSVGNHGWDHNHPDLAALGGARGGFTSIDNLEQCHHQVVEAAASIERKTGVWPEIFAYPFGESSQFIREQYFPGHFRQHRCRAALGTDAGAVNANSDRWNLPRYVCGRDWHSSEALLKLLK